MAKATAKPLSDEQLLTALSSSDYSTYRKGEVEIEAWFAAHPSEALERAKRLGDLALEKKYEESRRMVGIVVLPVLAGALKPGQSLPSKWDPLSKKRRSRR